MKRFSILASLLLALVFVLSPKAAGPDEEFIRAYILISEADSLAKNAQNKSAIQRYQSALNTLNALKSANANWKTSVINFRIDYVNRKRVEGVSVTDAVQQAGMSRLRPILLTSLTTFAGLSPLLAEQSVQAQFLIPMAISLAFGVLFSTAVTLVLVPTAYTILDDATAWMRGMTGRDEPSHGDHPQPVQP